MVELAALALTVVLAGQQPPADAVSPAVPAASDATQPAELDSAALFDAAATAADTEEVGGAVSAPVPAAQEAPENPYGLKAAWEQGDFVSRGTFIILLIMSLGSWYIIFTKLWDQSRLRRQYVQTEKNFWKGRNLQEGIASLTDADNTFRRIAEQGVKAAQHHEGRMTDQIPLHEWITQSMQRAVDNVNNDLQGGLSFLATTGSTAPFVGLFGTVWGIYHALIAIGVAGQASIDKVAGPVGEALIMTALGLAVAVPAVMGYNWLLRRNKALMEEVRYFANEIQQYLVSGARVDDGSRTPQAAGARSK